MKFSYIIILITFFTIHKTQVMAQSNYIGSAENDPRIFKDVRIFLRTLNSGKGKPIEQLSPTDARAVLVNAQNSVAVDCSGIQESEMRITQDGQTVRVNVIKPISAPLNSPVFIFIHGGGWVLGDYPTHRRLVRDLVVASGAIAVFPNYTPSPEARYPTAIQQIYAVTKWVSEHGDEIGVNGKNLAVVGNSVGGNMTASVVLMAKAKNGPDIKLQ